MPDLYDFVASSPRSDPSLQDSWSPSLRRHQQPEVASIQTPSYEPNARDSGDWRCRSCDADQYVFVGDSTWECLACGSSNFYNSARTMREVTDRGVWMYMPHGMPDAGEEKMSSASSRRRRRRRADGPPPDPDHRGAEETAESERLTHDPTVDPDLPEDPLPAAPLRHSGLPHRPGTQDGEPYKISRGRLAKDPALTDQERRDFRSVSGCLQWLGSQARPELCPAVSLSNHGLETEIGHLDPLRDGGLRQEHPLSRDHHPGCSHEQEHFVGDLHRCLMEQRCTFSIAARNLGGSNITRSH